MCDIKRIERVSISDAVYNQIKDKIIAQDWTPSTKLPSEIKLAEMFGVSRVSVRSAIQRLSAKGLLETRNGEGTFVSNVGIGSILDPLMHDLVFDPCDIIEMFEFRQVVEMLSCKLAATRYEDSEIDELENILKNMYRYKDAGDADNYSLYDMNFHMHVAKMSKNTLIEKVLAILREFIVAHVYKMNVDFGIEFGFEYHVKIFNALKERDSQKAEEYMCKAMIANIERVREFKKQTSTNL